MNDHILLICSVGGTPAPVAAAIKGCQPDKVIFVASPETEGDVEAKILTLLGQGGATLSPGQYDVINVADAQDFAACVETMHGLGTEVEKWLRRGSGYRVAVDFTGGTKCMSAALALVARPWPCLFSYVGGSQRTKEGIGVVVNGTETVLHTQNPWDSLGYQVAEEAVILFDKQDYQAAIDVLDTGRQRAQRPDLRSELRCLQVLSEAYLAWDLFDHARASECMKNAERTANNLRHLLPSVAENLIKTMSDHCVFLDLFAPKKPGRHVIADLIANAQRCSQRGRYDDAVARLYRAIEAIAQLRLREGHGIPDTGRVPLDRVPEPLRSQWSSRARLATLLLGLQQDYELLKALGDDLAEKFREQQMEGEKTCLTARNQSILAHGFEPVGKKAFGQLWGKTLYLAGMSQSDLPAFPKLSRPG